MNRLNVVVVGTVALIGGAAILVLQYQHVTRLRRETTMVRQEAVRAAALQQEIERLKQANANAARSLSGDERNELLRLRSEVTRLRQQVKDAAMAAARSQAPPTASVPQPTESSAPSAPGGPGSDGFLPVEQWADVGFGSPEAALQTMHWAMRHGNQERMKQALLMPAGTGPEGAESVGVDMIRVPAEGASGGMLSAGGVPSQEAVTIAMPELTGSRIVSRQDVSPEEVQFVVENQHADGTRLSAQMSFRRVGSEWKLAPTVIPAAGLSGGQTTVPP